MRKATIALIEAAESGSLTWEAIARSCLTVMSEADVADMASCEGLLPDDEDETEDDDTDDTEERSE